MPGMSETYFIVRDTCTKDRIYIVRHRAEIKTDLSKRLNYNGAISESHHFDRREVLVMTAIKSYQIVSNRINRPFTEGY